MILPIGKGLQSKKNSPGFTLTELVIVIGIVLVFLTISVPNFRRAYQDSMLKNATRELSSSLSYARDLAILEGINYEVNFDFSENKYTIGPSEDRASFQDRIVKIPDSSAKSSYYRYLPEKINFSRMIKQKLIFYPNGSSQDFFIYLENDKNNIYTIMVKGVYSQIKTFNFYYHP
jgi:prepilin-type N-terminal cleavage/methylation domain-containing protein